MLIPDSDKWNRADRFYDMHLLAYLGVIFDPLRDVVDVGANIGYVTKFFALRTRRSVLAIEPSVINFACLKENTSDLANVLLKNVAIGDTAGRAVFLDNGTVCSHMATSTRSAHIKDVEVTPLDSLVDGLDVGLLKIDVEGYEMAVLHSAQILIERCRPIVAIEVEPKWLKRYGSTPSDIFRFFRSLGYQPPVNKFGRCEDAGSCLTDQIFVPPGVYLPKTYIAYERSIRPRMKPLF